MTREEAKDVLLFIKDIVVDDVYTDEVLDILDIAIKALEQPEIIRCKDCKYMTEHYDTDGNAPYWTCSEWDSGTDYDGYCHYAERRTDD